ncbi:hypothetical protein ACRARG_04680 [Pseudooceanicola sp. C21-150M6]|uniref:hypothetical protein n=1 Tax=Pseudooceanicola sp. C21-150M6 TaxID=3434355 RepID=UPI003D8001A5
MNQHQRIMSEMAVQYGYFSEAVIVAPSGLAHRVFEAFCVGDEEAHIQYASLEHLKHMARVFLARRKDADGDEGEAYVRQGEFDLGTAFSGQLQDRYPLPRKQGEEPVYKLRRDLTADERAWNVAQLRKSGKARLEHADALEAEGQLSGAA